MEDIITSTGNPVENVSSLASLIDKYGGYVVVLSIFLVIFIMVIYLIMNHNNRMIKDLINNKNQLLDNVSNQNDKLLDTILDKKETDEKSDQEKNQKKLEEEKKILNRYIDSSIVLRSICKVVVEDIGCDRIGVYVFHNGNSSIHGYPFFKASCIFEICKPGSLINKTKMIRTITHTNIPLHTISSVISELYNNKVCDIEDVDSNVPEASDVKSFALYSDISSIYLAVIDDNENGIIGFTSVEFLSKENYKKSIEKLREVIVKTNEQIRPILYESVKMDESEQPVMLTDDIKM